MTAWCMEHPWMTFFVAMTLAYGVADGIRYLAKRRRPPRKEISK